MLEKKRFLGNVSRNNLVKIINCGMRNILLILLFIISNSAFSQVLIGNDIKSISSNESVLMNFDNSEKRGFLLPTVSEIKENVSNGTILLDGVEVDKARVKVYQNNKWVDLSLNDGNASSTKIDKQSNLDKSSKVIIGSDSSEKEGVLVLESNDKAMVLPIVNSTNDIINPSPGMIVFVTNHAIDKSVLAVYNGNLWTFWSAE